MGNVCQTVLHESPWSALVISILEALGRCGGTPTDGTGDKKGNLKLLVPKATRTTVIETPKV